MSDESRDPKPAGGISRRRFVTLVAAGSAALIANSAGAVAPKGRAARPAAGAAKPARAMSAVTAKELARQRGATQETLKVIRGHAMPPGTELGFVFRATRPSKKER